MIKIGYLVSYDYAYLLTSLKQVYPYVSKIYLAIDKDGKTWSGKEFIIPEEFWKEIEIFDNENKIEYYFDHFYLPELSPAECDTRERNMLLKKMGKGWLIQLDVDEYLYDFGELASYLNKYWYLTLFPSLTPVHFRGKLVTLFKKLPNGFLYIDNDERFSFITNQSQFTKTRSNSKIKNHFTNFCVIHQSWAREEEEIAMKIGNWGHTDDFDTSSYFEFWKQLSASNYKEEKNIHPLLPKIWDKLLFLDAKDEESFIGSYADENKQTPIYLDLKEWGKYWVKRFLNNGDNT